LLAQLCFYSHDSCTIISVMKHLPLTTIAAVVLVGCGEAQQASTANPEADVALLSAAYDGNIEVARQQLAEGADVNAMSVYGVPLDEAVEGDETEIADLLRKHGAKTSEELKAEGK